MSLVLVSSLVSGMLFCIAHADKLISSSEYEVAYSTCDPEANSMRLGEGGGSKIKKDEGTGQTCFGSLRMGGSDSRQELQGLREDDQRS